ncbi:MAG: metal ABC transporter permease [Chthonomonas sp.]|nr:metal ABC transporter permease [Chthonomonas sp.]
MTYNTLIVLLTAGLLGAVCGAVGVPIVLQRRGLTSDVIAHAALPGMALSFWMTRSKSVAVLLVGALISGLLAVACLQVFRRFRVSSDSALAVVLTAFFGAGIMFSQMVQNAVTDGSAAGLDGFLFGKASGLVRADLFVLIAVGVVVALLMIALRKEVRMTVFDPEFAQLNGFRPRTTEAVLTFLLGAIVVLGLPMVGVVLVAALTIVPALCGRLLADGYGRVVGLAAGIGLVSAVSGVLISDRVAKAPTGPLIILSAAVIFLAAIIFSPQRGLLSAWRTRRHQRRQAEAQWTR